MLMFRLLLIILLADIVVYTSIVGMNHGWNLLPIFFADIMAMNWPGQFNLDFMGMLLLSGLWTMWRNQFSPAGLLLGLFAFLGGVMFLSVYLLFLTFQTKGDMRAILLGQARAEAG